MTTSLPAQHEVADAVVALLKAAPSETATNAMRLDEAKRTAPDVDYVEVYAVPAFGGERRAGAWIGTKGSWRVSVRAMGKSELNASLQLKWCRDRLEFTPLIVGGGDGVMAFESADAVEEDSTVPGWWTGQLVFTVTL